VTTEFDRASQFARPSLTWNSVGRDYAAMTLATRWPAAVSPDAAWGQATGSGVRVCIVDSGVEGSHPRVGGIQASYGVQEDGDGNCTVVSVPAEDTSGHGTACASIVRSLAPDCEIHSVRVLGHGLSGSGEALLAGLRWAIEQRFDVVNLSLSTTRHKFVDNLRTLTDDAYFGKTVLVASAHNMPVESFPWRFSSVISVGSHDTGDPGQFFYNPSPPVEFFAHGTDVEVGWLAGGIRRATGNSFATPHIAGYCALILSKHPDLTAFQVKNLLYLTSANVRGTQ
jgi:subtilisin